MICLPIAPESRTLARADLQNACQVGDLVELCLDRFLHKPDVGELLAGLSKPVIVSCRRKKDGGNFAGSEEDRLALLQEALSAKPAYIELELDVASQFARTAGTQRLIAVNRPFRAVNDLADLQQQALNAGADVVKYVWPGVLIDSLAPVLAAMRNQPKPPIVGLPIGYGGRAFPILARRLGAPWVYAALEQGMESHDGMPTAAALRDQFDIAGVNASTRLIGTVGFGAVRDGTLRAFNAAFRELGLNCRCLPLEVGPVDSLPALLEQLNVTALVVSPGLGDYLFPMVTQPEPAAALGKHVDLLLQKKDGWNGYNVLWRSVLKVVERTLRRQLPEATRLETTSNLILGSQRLSRSILFGLTQLKGTAAVASPTGSHDEVSFCPHCGEALGSESGTPAETHTLDARYVAWNQLAATRPDVLFITDPAIELGFGPTALNPIFLQKPLVVVDVTSLVEETDILVEARERGCYVVRPRYILGEHLATQFKAITGQELPDAAFQQALNMTASES